MRCGRAAVSLILGVIVSLALFPETCRGQTVALVLKQRPYSGGKIDPEPGIYYFEPGKEITFTADPYEGYEFAHWLGDVADPKTSKTTTYLDRPKVIIAVFEPVRYQVEADDEERATVGSGASRGSAASRRVYAGGGGGGAISYPYLPQAERVSYIVIPEPGTVFLVGMCAIVLRKRRLHAR